MTALRRLASVALLGLLAGCVPFIDPPQTLIDPTGTWATSPDGVPPVAGIRPYPAARLVLEPGHILNPFGPDCANGADFRTRPLTMFVEMAAQHQWPPQWLGVLANGTDPVTDVEVTCSGHKLLELYLLGANTALLPRTDGAALILYRSILRPG